jgi:hypothetical protein
MELDEQKLRDKTEENANNTQTQENIRIKLLEE